MQQQNSLEPQLNGAFDSSDAAHARPVETSNRSSMGRWALLLFVRAYIVFLSPFFGGACKFYPSCSNYAREAIERHGARRGTVLALKRLLRCHPFTRGGIDLVPDELPNSPRATRHAHVHLTTSRQGKAQ